jgi:hypothetical protein
MEMSVLRTTSTTKIALGAAMTAAGFAALALMTAVPASAETATTISGSGSTQRAASDDALSRCLSGGGDEFGNVSFHQNSDGSWVATGTCTYF